MEDGNTLTYHNVQKKSTFHMELKLRGGGDHFFSLDKTLLRLHTTLTSHMLVIKEKSSTTLSTRDPLDGTESPSMQVKLRYVDNGQCLAHWKEWK